LSPLFIATVFTTLIGVSVLSIPFLQQRKIINLQWINFLCGVSFVLLGWYFNHLATWWTLLYALLWIAAYRISLSTKAEYFPIGRTILATLISSIILYLVNKAYVLYYLQQSWLGFCTTIFFGIGEIVFLLLLVFFTWDTVCALNYHLGPATKPAPGSDDYRPFVSIHLPTCNEPVDVVIKTIAALSRLSYPAYEVIVVDNNTDDPSLWTPVKECCEQLGFRFMHVNPHPGYKAGALNLALVETAPAAELIAVVDADYELDSDFLKDNVAVFQDRNIAFLQTPQRNKNIHANKMTRAFNPVYDFFYDVTMRARDQHNSIIFAGCAGLIRCSALREAGGWAEWSITEDAELSLRLLALGYKGFYTHRSYGCGLMPETFDDFRKQWFRYYFGGTDITRRHFTRTLLARNPLRLRQRLDYTIGGIINLGAAVMLLSTAGIIITAITYCLLQTQNPALAGQMFYLLMVFSNWLIIYNLYQALRMFLLVLVFRLAYQFSWSESLNATVSFQSLVTTQARAALWVLSGRKHSFVKTPKRGVQRPARTGARSVLLELSLCLATGVAMLFLFWTAADKPVVLGYVMLGLWQMLIYGSTVWRAFQSTGV
jgi:cellulose synthase/poly-beta-1,6-N-acetylglucosamine synthase-like glycosyltransferase